MSVVEVSVIVVLLAIAGFAVKTRTWWWIPGALVIAAGGVLTLDALTMKAQPYRTIVVLVELGGAFLVVVIGAGLLHAAEVLRDRFAASAESDEVTRLPRAISRRARALRRRP